MIHIRPQAVQQLFDDLQDVEKIERCWISAPALADITAYISEIESKAQNWEKQAFELSREMTAAREERDRLRERLR